MEESKERNFVCKFCSKRFPCGKSLGGHIRTHMKKHENSAESLEEEANKQIVMDSNKRSSKRDSGLESEYGLRENPKRKNRFVDYEIASNNQLVCRECGKVFNTLKALCGHMACHSEKEQMVLMDDQSDTEDASARRGSKKVMQKGIVFGDHSNSASSLSEMDQEEKEVLAICLMMLSRDSSLRKGSVSSFGESSDNNSFVFEAKSSSLDVRITLENGLKRVSKFSADEIVEAKEQRENSQLKSNGPLVYSSDNSDSGYFRNGPKKAESDVSSGKKCLSKVEAANGFQKDLTDDRVSRAPTKYDLRKSRYDLKANEYSESVVYESGETEYNSLEADSCAGYRRTKSCSSKNPIANTSKRLKKSKGHECPICLRVFKSGQALGGHKRSHFIGNRDDNTMVIREELAKMTGFIDLNLPTRIHE